VSAPAPVRPPPAQACTGPDVPPQTHTGSDALPQAPSSAAPALEHPGPPAAGWVPASACGPHCLPDPDPAGISPTERWRAGRRLALLAVVLLVALVVVALLPARPRRRAVTGTCRAVLRVAGVRVRAQGVAAPGALVVANHLSWIDVLALTTMVPARMLAKHEVRAWPLVGALAVRSGALFLDRTNLRALPATVAAAAEVLRAGEAVAVFPEGTTWCGVAAGPMRPAPFQAALDAGAPVQPVAIVLRDPDGRCAPQACFVGDQTLADALLRVLRARHTSCEITVLPALAPSGDRRALAAAASRAIADVTGVPHRSPASPRAGADDPLAA